MKKLFLTVFFTASLSAAPQQLPNSQLLVDNPGVWQHYEMDLGPVFGRSDVLLDDTGEKVITFMTLPSNVDPGKLHQMLNGMRDSFKAQGAEYTDHKLMVNGQELQMLKTVISAEGGVDHRVYVLHDKLMTLILFQVGDTDIDKPVYRNLIASLSALK
ncbi:hypothetical protein GCM10009092_06600 [Bowmanella denitrificans]|uniref:DUF1795 domain-containing protein n=1 Tax=Bowmanella denitrificans TaxID=366582 RepID=A0ABP3GG80_9ALTE|nr:hypothetical protein [Bowmanella denitrificans]